MTRRPVDNLLGLAVLATLAEGPTHRYEMAGRIRARGKDRQLAVKLGSLYTVVDGLARHGFVEVVGSSRDGARPERVTYAITAAGRQELRDWARELLATPRLERTALVAGLSVLAALGPDEAIDLLSSRLARLASSVARLRADLDLTSRTVPRLFLVEDEYALAMLAAEETWLTALVEELRSGQFAGLAEWYAYHRPTEEVDR